MANVVLKKNLSIDGIMQILEKGFPNFVIKKKSLFLIECNTGLGGKFNISLTGMTINVYPKIPILWAIIMGFSIIGLFLFIGLGKNPTAVAIANYLNENQNNSEVPINIATEIPDTCPHCKNPNSKKIRLCEWCGNQIV